jgi:lipoprotein-anchoring transpeptidase ErfK/SrfK
MFRTLRIGVLIAAALVVTSAALASSPAPSTEPAAPPAFPAAGPIVVSSTIVRARPSDSAKRIAVIHQFRSDFRAQYVLAIAGRRDARGNWWVQIRVQRRPNGTLGWIRASAVQLSTMHNRIVVHRGLRKIDVYADGALVVQAPVAIGSPGRETPLGNFYVTARFTPEDPFLGVFAVETSAYSKMTEWPGGGLVGIHGTSKPELLGQAVSHGCVRIANATAEQLRRYAPLGTPISIVAD